MIPTWHDINPAFHTCHGCRLPYVKVRPRDRLCFLCAWVVGAPNRVPGLRPKSRAT